jgi:hypothetical protein
MKLFLMQKYLGVPVLSGTFNTYEEIEEFKKNYWGDPNKDWSVIEVSDEEFDEKFSKAVIGELNY